MSQDMFFLIISVLVANADAPSVACNHLNESKIDLLTLRVREAKDEAQRGDALGSLSRYWNMVYEHERRNAHPKLVSNLGDLLEIREARFIVSSMLFDVGPNLKYADRSIDLALRDQKIVDDRNRDASFPMEPTSIGLISESLMCIRNKARGEAENPRLCRFIRNARRGD